MRFRSLAGVCGWCVLVVVLTLSIPASAQTPPLSEQSEISMLTILPGDQIHAEFGHSAFRVRDPERGIDRMYNYGTFDFSDPWFVPKFTYGRLQYYLSVVPFSRALPHYRRQSRPVIEQKLHLNRAQRDSLFRFLEINARLENRTYQYDFLFDNCSTRIRDALKQALGDAVQFAPRPDPQQSFRHLLDPYVADRPALDLGFDLALGTPTDRVATPRETMFLPIYLMEAFDHATIRTDTERRSLVTRTDTLFWIDDYKATERAFPWVRWLSWFLLLGGVALTGWEAFQSRPPRSFADVTLMSIAGIAGLVMVFLWFIAEHTVTNYNWNLLWAWPTHLIAAVVLTRSGKGPGLRYYLGATAATCGLVAIGWTLWPQDFHAAIFPFVVLLTLRAGWRAYRSYQSTSS